MRARGSLSRSWPGIAIFLAGTWIVPVYGAERATGEEALRGFLQGYVQSNGSEDRTVRYSDAQVSLDNKTPMRLVYLSGRDWCGSGGCTALLLKSDGAKWKIVNRFTLARLPIRILPSLTKGWHDITMPVSGGGASSHISVLRYNGSKYPSNPSIAPTLRSSKQAEGDVELPLKPAGEPLYP